MKLRLLVLFPLLCSMGCGGGAAPSSKRDPVYPVSGTVTYKSKPVIGADVTFTVEGGKRSAFGKTDDKGVFRLTTYGPNDGAMAGKHSITITKAPPAAPAVKLAPVESKDYAPPAIIDTGIEPVVAVAVEGEIPLKYSLGTTSGLMAVVEKGAKNDFTLDLTD